MCDGTDISILLYFTETCSAKSTVNFKCCTTQTVIGTSEFIPYSLSAVRPRDTLMIGSGLYYAVSNFTFIVLNLTVICHKFN